MLRVSGNAPPIYSSHLHPPNKLCARKAPPTKQSAVNRPSYKSNIPELQSKLKAMPDIIQSLESDARFVLETLEFRSFLQELIKEYNQRYSRYHTLKFSNNSNDWLLSRLEYPLGLSEYQYIKQTREYTDEFFYMSRRYSLLLKLGELETRVEFNEDEEDGCIYNSTIYGNLYDVLHEEIDIDRLFINSSYKKDKLISEISCIACYAIHLL